MPARARPCPRALAIASTRTSIGSPSRYRPPRTAAHQCGAVSFSSKNSPGRRRAGRKPSKTSPKRTKRPGADQAGDLALPLLVPAALEEPRRAATRGRCRRRGTRAWPPRARARTRARRAARGRPDVGRRRWPSSRSSDAVHDEVRVAADRRGEVAVRRAREAGVAEVARVVARLLERAQHERRERLPAAAGLRARTRRSAPRSRRRAPPPAAATARPGAGGVGTPRSASFASRSSIDCGSGRSCTR